MKEKKEKNPKYILAVIQEKLFKLYKAWLSIYHTSNVNLIKFIKQLKNFKGIELLSDALIKYAYHFSSSSK